ncbi:MAG: sulfite exporter TauE/SafE family protein [Blastococcus sp.]
MKTLVLITLVGLGAQLIDGSLGMSYGVTSTTLLLLLGATPAAASATVHLAEIGTTLASGLSHARFGNVDWKVVAKLGLPGAIGAFVGAHVLSGLATSLTKPLMAVLLFALGLYLLARFTLRGFDRRNLGKPLRKRFLVPLGLGAGFIDAIAGGGWGPIGTSSVLTSGRLEPRRVVGSIDSSKFLVSSGASLGFVTAMGAHHIAFSWVAGLLIGGVVAAPIAAWLVRHMPARLLGSLVGGMLLFTNARTLLGSEWIAASGAVRGVAYAVLFAMWALAVVHSVRMHRAEKAVPAAEVAVPEVAVPEQNVVADVTTPAPAGRPSAPQA